MRKLIIGCGYLGEPVAQEWLNIGFETWVLTRSEKRAADFAKSGFRPLVCDVLDKGSLQKLPPVETILYSVGFDRESNSSKRAVYVEGLRNVLERVRGNCQQFVYISSTSVYGQKGGEFVDESSAVIPNEENGCICRDAEAVVWEYSRMTNHEARMNETEAKVLRLAGLYGPRRLLARERQLRHGGPLSGNPDAWLNLIHVEDAVQAVLAAEHRGQPGETYLISDNRPLRRREYYSALASQLGVASPQFMFDADDPQQNRLNKRCVNRRMREELRVELRYPTIIEGLHHLFEGLQ